MGYGLWVVGCGFGIGCRLQVAGFCGYSAQGWSRSAGFCGSHSAGAKRGILRIALGWGRSAGFAERTRLGPERGFCGAHSAGAKRGVLRTERGFLRVKRGFRITGYYQCYIPSAMAGMRSIVHHQSSNRLFDRSMVRML